MHFVSTINPLSKSEGNISVALFIWNEQRKFLRVFEDHDETIQHIKQAFNIHVDEHGTDGKLTLTTATFDVCKGNQVTIDESAYPLMWNALDEVHVVIENEEEQPPRVNKDSDAFNKGKARASIPPFITTPTRRIPLLFSHDDSKVVGAASISQVEDSDQHGKSKDISTTELTFSEEESQASPPRKGPEPIESAILKNLDDIFEIDDPTPAQSKELRKSTEEVREGEVTAKKPKKFKPAVAVKPAAIGLDELNQEVQSMVQDTVPEEVDERTLKTQRPKPRLVVKPNAIPPDELSQELGVSLSKTNNANNPFKVRNQEDQNESPKKDKGPILDDPRFEITITGPDTFSSAQFKTRGKHPVRKVLQAACKYFEVEYDRSHLILTVISEDETGERQEHEFECNRDDTISRCGVNSESDLSIRVDETSDFEW